MPKRSRGKKPKKGTSGDTQKKKKSRKMPEFHDESDIDLDDDIDKFHANRDKILLDSDSDDDYREKEEEVLPVVSDSSDEEAQMKFYQSQLQKMKRQGLIKPSMDSDSEAESEEEEDEEAGLPSRQAWGDKKSLYYGGDVRDAKIGLGHEDREGLALLEEKEALEIQRRQRARYTEADLALDTVFAALESTDEESLDGEKKDKKELRKRGKKNKKERKGAESGSEEDGTGDGESKRRKSTRINEKNALKQVEVVSARLSDKDQLEVLKKEAPEFIPLYTEMFDVAEETSRLTKLYLALQEPGSAVSRLGLQYLASKSRVGHLLLLHSLLYVHMKLDRFPTQNHPIMERIFQFRASWKAFHSLDQEFESRVRKAAEQLDNGEVVTFTKTAKTKKSLKRKLQENDNKDTKRVKREKDALPPWIEDAGKESDEEASATEGMQEGDDEAKEEGGENRTATKKMEKNEGLKAYKKRKLRHARVKHREKFRKAKIRRKGQVRDHHPEVVKYRGEATGIRAGVIRSRKL